MVENRPGGANVIAAVSVAKAPPDGHTLLMTTSTTMAINVSVFKNLAYDPAKDFVPVALVSGVPFVLVVNAGAAGEVDRRPRAAKPRRNPAGSPMPRPAPARRRISIWCCCRTRSASR